MLLKVLKWFRGYVAVEVESDFPERFLNLCAREDINLWKVERTEKGLSFRLAAYDEKRAEFIANRLGVPFQISKTNGAPFVMKKYRKRKAFFAGGLIFVLMIIMLSKFIWSIEITGNQTVSDDQILYQLSKLGCKVGMLSSQIDATNLADQMRIAVPEIAWIALNLNGSNLSVEIKERDMKPEIVDLKTPTDVIAIKDGVILSMEIADGDVKVERGNVVVAGDVLATGKLYGERSGYRFVAARGKVYARTTAKIRSSSPNTIEENVHTGQKKERRTLILFGLPIKLYFNSGISYPEYDKITKISELKIGRQITLPISVVTDEYLACKSNTRQLAYEEQLAVCRARRDELFARNAPGAEILNYGEEVRETESGMVLITEITAKENIARTCAITSEEMERLRAEDEAKRQEAKKPVQ